jgi:hypothetical protein
MYIIQISFPDRDTHMQSGFFLRCCPVSMLAKAQVLLPIPSLPDVKVDLHFLLRRTQGSEQSFFAVNPTLVLIA